MTERITINAERQVELFAYMFDDNEKHPAMLILPGGGYKMCSPHEGEPIALAYKQAGFNAFVLNYSVGEYGYWDNPLKDYEYTMSLIKKNAGKWNIDENKIALLGFSAGGHLAAFAATSSRLRPVALLLGYACTLQGTIGAYGAYPDTVSKVNKDTPPTFLFAASDDNVVPIDNTLLFASALSKNKVPFECRIYSCGGHGFALGQNAAFVGDWLDDSVIWLNNVFVGKFNDFNFSIPDRDNDFLNLENTIGHILQIPEAEILLRTVVPILFDADGSRLAMIKGFSLGSILRSGLITENEMLNLQNKLCKIKNER